MPNRSNLAARLQLRHLRLIDAVAAHRQLSLAAQALALTQPAASRTLAEVESLVGTALFDRHPRGMTLTPVGEGLARHARNILDELAHAAEAVEKLRQGTGGVVRIGAVTGAAVGYVVPAIRLLKLTAPDVELHIDVANSAVLLTGLEAMRYDMVLGRLRADADPAAFTIRRARGERVHILAHRDHRCAGRARLDLAELATSDWVIQGPGAPIRRAIEEAFLDIGAPLPRRVTNTASLLMTLSLLRNPEVVTPISQEVADLLTSSQPDLRALNVTEPINVAPYSLITLKARRLSPAAMRCHDLLSDILDRQREKAQMG